ncbi:MAG: glycosyltransferase, partial [bacterium]
MTEGANRILMCSESYLPRISGVAHSLHALTTGLRAHGLRVLIAAPKYPGYTDTDPDVVRFPSLRPPHQREFPLAIPYAPAVWRRLMDEDLDLVHTHAPFLMGAVAARLARRKRLPLVFTHHTLYDEYAHYAPLVSRRIGAPAIRRFVTAYANRCACVIAPSDTLARRLRQHGVQTRIETVPTGAIDPAVFGSLDPSEIRLSYSIPVDRPLFVTASRLAREKSVDLVLEAFARILARRAASLLVVGGGPEERALRKLAQRLGVNAHTVF